MRQPVLLDILGKLPDHPLVRAFIFGASDIRPSFIATYIPDGRNTQRIVLAEVTSFTKSRRARIEPHTVVLADESTIELLAAAGCGCGSPLKRVSQSTALSDWDAANPAELSA